LGIKPVLTEKQKLEVLTTLGTELNQVKDLDILMEHILTEARRVVNADETKINYGLPIPRMQPCRRDCRKGLS